MGLFYNIPAEILASEFQHRGWFFGLVPVYIGNLKSGKPTLATRNGVPDIWMDVVEGLFAGFCFIAACLVHDFAPSIPIRVTGRLDGKPLENGL